MAFYNTCIFLLIYSALYTTLGSLVRVNNGGYEDIVIAIHPNVKEDAKVIENIQNMVKEATSYLFQATHKRLFIKSVKILIPSTWARGSNYTRPTSETYKEADIIIASPHLKYGDDPYTLQYGRCGEPGRYIHLTPNFLLNNSLLSGYGSRGRVLIHEWAHLRWGVYDEYNEEKPYYLAENGKIEATRCSVDIFGANIIQTSQCQGESCPTRPCNFDPDTGLYEKGCIFLPQTSHFVRESIMYAQALNDITEFCDSRTHNTEAPNLQNRMCNSRSTWEVIMNSNDVISTPPRPDVNIPEPTITLLQSKERVVTLVLDMSESMNLNNRLGRLHQAVDLLLTQIIESSAYVGVTQFATSRTIISSLQRMNKQQRENLISLVPSPTNEMANICHGILAGLEVNRNLDGSAQNTEMILLTDGEDNFDMRLCFPEIAASGVITHVVAFGQHAEEKLASLVGLTGGVMFSASDNLDINGMIGAFTRASSRNWHDSEQDVQLESIAERLQPSACLNGTVFIDSTVGNDTFFFVAWQTGVPRIHLEDPIGKVYDSASFTSDASTTLSSLHIPGTAERGRWDYRLCNSHTSPQSIGLTVTSKAADENVPPILASCHMNQNANTYPNPMVVYASVSQGYLPVVGVKVMAIIEPENGKPVTLELLDSGAGADTAKNDGIYSRYFTNFTTNGKYSLKVRAIKEDNKSHFTVPKNRALYIPGYIDHGNKIIINPLKPQVNNDDLQLHVGPFSRTASGGSFLVSNVPIGVQPDIYKPEKISDLVAQLMDRRIILTWTATGDDLDQGQASRYELRMNTDLMKIKNNFESSTLVNTTSLIPSNAGSKETFHFVPENVNMQNGTAIFFAIIAIDKSSQKSDVSNIAQSVFYNVPPLPTLPPPKTTVDVNSAPKTSKFTTISTSASNPSDGPSTTTPELTKLNLPKLILIVCAVLILICVLVSIVICICCRKRKNQRKHIC